MVCWEIMLSKGQKWDWLGDPFFRVQTLLILFVFGSGLIYRELRLRNPLVALRTLTDQNFLMCCIIIFLRLRRALRQHHQPTRFAADAFWLQRNDLGSGPVAGRPVPTLPPSLRNRASSPTAAPRISLGR